MKVIQEGIEYNIIFTLFFISRFAPRPMSRWSMSSYPLTAASCSAVRLYYNTMQEMRVLGDVRCGLSKCCMGDMAGGEGCGGGVGGGVGGLGYLGNPPGKIF